MQKVLAPFYNFSFNFFPFRLKHLFFANIFTLLKNGFSFENLWAWKKYGKTQQRLMMHFHHWKIHYQKIMNTVPLCYRQWLYLPVPTNTLWYAQIVKQTQRKACLFCHICDINNFGFVSMCAKALKLDGEADYIQTPNPIVTPLK